MCWHTCAERTAMGCVVGHGALLIRHRSIGLLHPTKTSHRMGLQPGKGGWIMYCFYCCFISQNCKSPGNVLSAKNSKEYEKPIFTGHWTLRDNLQLLSDISKLTRKTLVLIGLYLTQTAHSSSSPPTSRCSPNQTIGRRFMSLIEAEVFGWWEKNGDVAKLVLRFFQSRGILSPCGAGGRL